MMKYNKPRLKPIVEYCTKENQIYFFHRPGVAIQLNDPSHFITTVCQLMDGVKTLDELAKHLRDNYPKETPYLERLLDVLDREKLLEDTDKNTPAHLSEYDMSRWSRNIEFFGSYCAASENKYAYQEKLKSTKVTIFGLGGVGSNILLNLAAMGVGNIKAVDFDKVELSNLNRQVIYDEADIGALKSVIAHQRMSKFIPQANIEFINQKISSSHEIEAIISDQDIVIAAIDQPREKIMDWFNTACVRQNIPFLCGSLDSRVVIYYTIFPGKTGCIECWKSNKSTEFTFQELIQDENFVSAESPNVAIMSFISLVSGFIANEFLKITTQIAEPQSLGKLCTYDFLTSQIKVTEQWEKNPNCSVCSHL